MRKSKIRSFPETCRWKTPTAILNLNWVKKNLERLEITAKTDFGEIDVPDTMENLMQKEEDEQSFSYVPDQPAGRITLMTKDGDISLEND